MLTRGQALGGGLTERVLQRLVANGAWQRLDRGIFLVGPVAPTWTQRARGALLWAGAPAALGFEAAGHRHGLLGPPAVIDVWVSCAAPHREPRADWRLHYDGSDRLTRSRGDVCVTSVEDTVLDLADRLDLDGALSVLTRALASRRTHESRIRTALDGRLRVRHRAVLADVVAERRGYESALEYHVDVDVLVPHGLPDGRAQVVTDAGRVDRLIEEYRLVLEADGRAGHEGAGVFRDMERDNANTLQGLRSLRLGWFDVRVRPCVTALTVATVLRQQGWSGAFRACRRCEPSSVADFVRRTAGIQN